MEPKKLIQILDFIDQSQEAELLNIIPDNAFSFRGRNKILRYGSSKPYPSGIVSKDIPEVFTKLKIPFEYDSVTINEYLPGDKIDWHIDLPDSGDRIMILSLLSDSILSFKMESEIVMFEIPRFSLSIFSDSLRWEWEHSLIAEEKRVSIVFRNSKEKSRWKQQRKN